MRYIAKKVKDGYEISGLKELKTINGDTVEVIIDSKVYETEALETNLKAIKDEKALYIEQYDNTIKDIEAMLEAINKVK